MQILSRKLLIFRIYKGELSKDKHQGIDSALTMYFVFISYSIIFYNTISLC